MTAVFGKLANLSRTQVRLLLEASALLTLARLALVLVPFPRIGRYLGRLQPPSPQPALPQAPDAVPARQVGWAVNRVADCMPAVMVCLPRALAAWQMLHRRGIPSRLHFGVPVRHGGDGGRFETHAWLSSSGIEVTGYPAAHGCVELGFFARGPAMPEDARLPVAPYW